mgnify:CR=1 FL=1
MERVSVDLRREWIVERGEDWRKSNGLLCRSAAAWRCGEGTASGGKGAYGDSVLPVSP